MLIKTELLKIALKINKLAIVSVQAYFNGRRWRKIFGIFVQFIAQTVLLESEKRHF